MKYPSSMSGFSLIELIMAVAVLGILLAIAIPNYDEFKKSGYRTEGTALLSDIAARQERYYSQQFKYVTVTAKTGSEHDLETLGLKLNSNKKVESPTGKYEVTVAADASGYLLTATQKFGDSKCGNLTLDGNGKKNKTGTGLDLQKCWP